MGSFGPFLLLFVSLCFFIPVTHQLQSSQTQVLLQLRKQLEYPKSMEVWDTNSEDFCYSPSSPQLIIACQDNSVKELKIMGDKPAKVSKFDGFAIPNQTLSAIFSIDSLVTTLSRLTNLKVLSLVSLGIWGPLPDKIHRLYSLELLDFSSNFLFGSIPPKISTMVGLQTLTLDGNFFNDTVPDWLNSLSNLTFLSLKGNRLKGPFPPSICGIKTLTVLALSQNKISGKLPAMDSLTNLHVLDLRENQVDSELPVLPKQLVTVLLSQNFFSGEIPLQFDELVQLQHLDLSFNFLQGTPPAALFSLPNISYLNLASNKLSGSLPHHLSCGSVLGFVDISTNRLIGGLPSCLNSPSVSRVVKFGGNCLSVDLQHQHQEPYCKEIQKNSRQSGSKDIGILIAVIGGVVIVMILLGYGFVAFCRRYCIQGKSEQHLLSKALPDNSASGFSSEVLANARFISQATKLGTQGLSCRLFSLQELKEATENFDHSKFMGEGSMGKIYKGKLENGTCVAVRCLALFKRYSIRNIKLRLDLLSKLRHPHLVCLLGHCIDTGGQNDSNVHRVFLVYEYVPNGNLRAHLSEDSPEKGLKWSERLAVLIGVAKAVHFLHTGMIPGFFNNQLKTNNILLDEHQIAKLSDYGLSIITEEIEKLEAKGEGQKWQITKSQDDVYCFGFILLEALVGPSVSGRGEAFLLNEMSSFGSQDGRRRIVDPIVLTTCSQESLSIVISITNKCISPESSRPSFEDVLWNLQYAAQVQATTDGEQK
ncbi:probable inactive leucine-rich repeat receptor-like protein kinase At3g03770 [Macadamia integrifolia]|uniref:probable inactive leucine-rich repeat receptor-like protein kinase At3g03770 n=1 Tax=Macadamia integrifolia TaxID=60698 RepID=UPI001C500012|nr:probable inactive leucine-rich repeat receptor-like protein kinase At3g03770 [Macadamia integrifolia]